MSNLGNKQIMANNIRLYMGKASVTAKDICTVLKIPMPTFSDWINAKTYPRIDKIEMLANYFGISKADLVEEHLLENETSNDKEMCNIFAKNLNDIMLDKGIKQADIVRELHVAKATVSGWCAGLNIPRTDALSRLTKMLDVQLSDLLIKKEPDNPLGPDEQLDDVAFALYGKVKNLSDAQKRDVLRFVEFIEAKDE